ncbi:MAG: SdpI family protein [Planctomycetota bacterium]
MFALATTLLLSGSILIAVCLPLVFNVVPRNALYGMRIKQAFESDVSWRHLNEVGGMLFAMTGFPLILGGGLGFFLGDEHVALVGAATSAVTLAAVGMAVCLFLRYARGYEQASGS